MKTPEGIRKTMVKRTKTMMGATVQIPSIKCPRATAIAGGAATDTRRYGCNG
jgi:hypothetical protein